MQLTNLSLTGQSKNLGDSNIVPNALTFDFLAFKSLTTLILIDMEINKDKIGTFALLRNTLINFESEVLKQLTYSSNYLTVLDSMSNNLKRFNYLEARSNYCFNYF